MQKRQEHGAQTESYQHAAALLCTVGAGKFLCKDTSRQDGYGDIDDDDGDEGNSLWRNL